MNMLYLFSAPRPITTPSHSQRDGEIVSSSLALITIAMAHQAISSTFME
jgi:hypothetical protein